MGNLYIQGKLWLSAYKSNFEGNLFPFLHNWAFMLYRKAHNLQQTMLWQEQRLLKMCMSRNIQCFKVWWFSILALFHKTSHFNSWKCHVLISDINRWDVLANASTCYLKVKRIQRQEGCLTGKGHMCASPSEAMLILCRMLWGRTQPELHKGQSVSRHPQHFFLLTKCQQNKQSFLIKACWIMPTWENPKKNK